MGKYYKLDSYTQNGSLNIDLDIFNDIASHCVNDIIVKRNLTKDDLCLAKKIKTVNKDNKLSINISLNIKKDLPLNEICLDIQKSVVKTINLLLEQIPFKIEVCIDKVL